MKELYEKSIQAIKEASKQMSISEYNQLAKEKGLLSSESLKYISRKSFVSLCKEIRKERKKERNHKKVYHFIYKTSYYFIINGTTFYNLHVALA